MNLFSISGEGCGFDIDCEEWAKETGGRLKLAVATNAKGMDSVAGILDDVQATLPSNCRLYIENKALYLRAPKNSGSVLIVK